MNATTDEQGWTQVETDEDGGVTCVARDSGATETLVTHA